MAVKVQFFLSTEFEVQNMTESIDGAIYFTEDGQNIYRGDGGVPKLYSGVAVSESRPTYPVSNKIYVIGSVGNYTLESYINGSWVNLSGDVDPSYIYDAVVAMQIDSSLVPNKKKGNRYIILNSSDLHADFGNIIGLEDNDIVEYDGYKFVVSFDSSESSFGIDVLATEDINGDGNTKWHYSKVYNSWVKREFNEGFKPIKFYDFNSDSTGDWHLINSTLDAPYNSIVRYNSTAQDPSIWREFNFDGGQNKLIKIRYKVINGSDLRGQIFYATSKHSFSGDYYKEFKLIGNSKYNILELDMSNLTLGGTDWIDNIINGIRFDLGESNDVVIDIDWIGIGKIGWGTQHFEDNVLIEGDLGTGKWLTLNDGATVNEDAGIIVEGTGNSELSKWFYHPPNNYWYALGNIYAQGGTLEAGVDVQCRGNWNTINKAGSGWLTWATRNTSGSEAVIDFSNIGSVAVNDKINIGNPTVYKKLNIAHNSDATGISVQRTDNGSLNILGYDYMGTFSNHNLRFYANSVNAMTINASGNVGIGTGDIEAWHTSYGAIEFPESAIMYSRSVTNGYIGLQNNAYYDSGGWKYKRNAQAANIVAGGGVIYFNVAPLGSADGVLTWKQAMVIDNSGNVGINKGTLSAKLHIYDGSTASSDTIVARITSNKTTTFGKTTILIGEDNDIENVKISSRTFSGAGGSQFVVETGIGVGSYQNLLIGSSGQLGIGGGVVSGKTTTVHGDMQINGTLDIGGVEYTWPGADGTSGYVLSTDGLGNLSWAANVGGGTPGTGITSINGLIATTQTIAGSSPISVSSTTSTHTISITQAGMSSSGYLSTADWNTFNNKGTVSSVAMSVPTGFSISGSPITSTGTMALSFSSGYSLPTISSQSNWNTAYGWGNHALYGYATASNSMTFTNKSGDISQWTNDSGYVTSSGVTSVAAGNGMNFTTITGTGSVTLGQPSTLNASTTNSVTSNSHTHAITGFLETGSTYNDVSPVFYSYGSKGADFTWDTATYPNSYAVITNNLTISVSGVSDGNNGVIRLVSSGNYSVTLSTSGFTQHIDAGANITGSPGQIFLNSSKHTLLTYQVVSTRIYFNVAEYNLL